MKRKQDIKVGDKVRVALHWVHYLKFGAVCTVTAVNGAGHVVAVVGPVKGSSDVCEQSVHSMRGCGFKLAKQAMKKANI